VLWRNSISRLARPGSPHLRAVRICYSDPLRPSISGCFWKIGQPVDLDAGVRDLAIKIRFLGWNSEHEYILCFYVRIGQPRVV
jgi:hypothetical protein